MRQCYNRFSVTLTCSQQFLVCNVCQQPRWDLLSVVIGIQCLLSIDLDVFALA